MRRLRLWVVRRLLGRELSEIEAEIDEEFRFHLDMKTAALIARGMDPESARAAAAACFGDPEKLRREGARNLSGARRKERRANHLDWLVQDVRDGTKQLARRPGFTFLAAGTLALGLTTSTAVFTYVNAYQRPFPGADAAGLYLLNNRPYTIVGVAGRDFLGSTAAFRPQVWLPFEQYKQVYWARSNRETNRDLGTVSPYVRVAGNATPARVRESLSALARGLDREAPLSDRVRRFLLEPAAWISPTVRDAEMPTARIMVLAAAGLLLLACANMANLVLSAGARRRHEMALRGALGASRGRLMRQLVTESLLLSLLAGALALVAAGPAAARLSSYFARPSVWGANVPREMAVDPRVIGFALAAAVLTGLATGLMPALRASSRNPATTLNAGGAHVSADRPRRSRIPGTREALVSVQVALSVVLLFVAGLVLRTLDTASSVDAGFDTRSTLASYVSTSSMGVPVEERESFFRDLVRRFEELPWVSAATVAEYAPLSWHAVEELGADGSDEQVATTVARVVPGYFEAMGMEIVRGRALVATDTVDANGVVVVNETLARRMADNGNAVGRRLVRAGSDGAPGTGFEVVGVVRDARQTSLLDEPGPVAYFSLPQGYYAPGNGFLLRVAGNPAALVDQVEQELRSVDPRIAIVNILPYSEVVRGFLYTQRMNAELFSVIAALGLLLAAAGVFGVVALAVVRRRREIGVRVAIGATRGGIARLVLATISTPVALGLLAGAAGAVAATRLVESLLWGVTPADPVAMGAGAGILLGAVALAVVVPLLRALDVDPVASLRVE